MSSATTRQTDPDDPLKLNAAPRTSVKEQRKADWEIVKKLVQHVWPKGEGSTKRRVVLALTLLIGGKVSVRSVSGAARCGMTDDRYCATGEKRSSSMFKCRSFSSLSWIS